MGDSFIEEHIKITARWKVSSPSREGWAISRLFFGWMVAMFKYKAKKNLRAEIFFLRQYRIA